MTCLKTAGGGGGQCAVASCQWEGMHAGAPARFESVDDTMAATFDLYPWEPDRLVETEAGKLLLKAVAMVQADRVEQVDGLHWRFFVDRADGGVALFNTIGLPRVAGEAGLWYEQIDQGSVEFAAIRQVFMPWSVTMEFVVNFHSGEVLLPDGMWATLHRAGRLGDRIDAYFTLGGLYLPEIANLDLARRTQLFTLAFPR